MRTRRVARLALMAAAVVGIALAHGAEECQPDCTDPVSVGTIYWTTFRDGGVQRWDCPNETDLFIGSPETGYARDIAIDSVRGKVYWTEQAAEEPNGIPQDSKIHRSNLDGTDAETLLITCCTPGLGGPSNIDLDTGRAKMYWIEPAGTVDRIYRANIDGTGQEIVVDGLSWATALAVDPIERKIYYGNRDSSSIDVTLRSANLDGTRVRKVATFNGHVVDLVQDVRNGWIYIASRTTDEVWRMSVDGSTLERLVTNQAATGLAMDAENAKLYWSSHDDETISRANLDGSNIELLHCSRDPSGPAGRMWDIALDLGPPDCNGNGVADDQDIVGGTSDDCNSSGVPDECEPDCNLNGVADECDLSGVTSDDCNNSWVPDECEPDLDCNNNGLRDICETAAGTTPDCNLNEIPDECEPDGDCNATGVLDICDIAAGTSQDCNDNDVPDECDVIEGTSPDCDSSGVPDECQTNDDCNGNGVPDSCDVVSGTSTDCNSNWAPDECDPPQADCNENATGDLCDIVEGTSGDCNANWIPDECESPEDCNENGVQDFCDLAEGTSADCDSSGTPDECDRSEDCNLNSVQDICDIAGGTSVDCNTNSTPDECEPVEDCNGNNVQDICDIAGSTSWDCNNNVTPDECESPGDCNNNGFPDICDVVIGGSSDCNRNSVPDECEPPQADCNANGVADGCDIIGSTSKDCNENSVPDSCDLTGGTSADCNANQVPDLCDIAGPTSEDVDTDGVPDECCVPGAPVLQQQFDENGDLTGPPEPKSRFLAVRGGDPGRVQTIRVTWLEMPAWPTGHADLVGQQKWMLQPVQVCENSGQGTAITPPNCAPAPGMPQRWFWAAELTCDPSQAWLGDLTALTDYCTGSGEACATDADCAAGTCGVDGVIHLVDPGIAPSRAAGFVIQESARYGVQVLAAACPPLTDETTGSVPLETQTAGWGDIMGTIACPMGSPNGDTTLVGDVTEAISKFSNNPCAPKKTRVDMDQDFQIGFPTDILMTLNAFSNGGAGFAQPAPAPCPAGP